MWAVDDDQATKAVEHLRCKLWPYWFLFKIAGVRLLAVGGQCPPPDDVRAPLASASREQWMWVLIPLGAEFGALARQTTDGPDVGRVARDARGGDVLPCI